MTFAHPKMLWLLAIAVPLLGLFLWRSWRRKQYLIGQFVQSRMLAQLTVGVSKTLQKTRLWLQVAAVALILFALARPQWGLAWEEARQQGLDILVAIDTSRSMLAQDLAPNRLTRAKLAALDLMQLARNDRLGLIAFAGTSFLQCPLTLDEEAFRQSIELLDVDVIPQGGTVLANPIETAIEAFGSDADTFKVLVLFTDGEDHEPGAIQAAERAAQRGIRIFTVGVGTPAGDILRQRDESGNLVYIKDPQGNAVKSRLNEALLTQIATSTQGFYLPLSDPRTMELLYERGLAPLPRSELATRMIRRLKEHYQWFLGIAILALIAEMFLPDRKRVERRPDSELATGNTDLKKAVAAGVAVLLCSTAAFASTGSALKKYEAGEFHQALRDFEQVIDKRPDDPRLRYNAGAAAYKADEFDTAIRHFSTALTAPDLDLQQQAHYNLGNSFYRVGEQAKDADQKLKAWQTAVQQYETALKLNSADEDSKFNLELVKQKIAELQQQQQQQQQEQKQNQEDDQQKQDENEQNKEEQQQQDQGEQSEQDQQQKSEGDSPDQQEQQNQQQETSDENEKKEEQPSSSESEPKPNADQEQKDSQSGDSSDERGDQAEAQNQSVKEGQMTPEQVRRLLDAQKGEEKAMLFRPSKPPRKPLIFKDW